MTLTDKIKQVACYPQPLTDAQQWGVYQLIWKGRFHSEMSGLTMVELKNAIRGLYTYQPWNFTWVAK